jgi:2-polyprenyl-6-methoxyphenol hydroxylase-like FAD-dependent oxidoreductase
MGYGVSKAAEDARALADALAPPGVDVEAGLARFEAERQPIGERVVRHGRKLGTHLGVNLETDDDRAMWKLLQDPHAMLRHIATPHFLEERLTA